MCLSLFLPFITITIPQFSQELCVLFPQVTFQLQPARVYLEDTFVYYIKTLFHTYIPDSAMVSATAKSQKSREPGSALILPEQVCYSKCYYLATDEAGCCHYSLTETSEFLPGASVGAGVGPPCAAAEVDHPAGQPVGQHPRLPKVVHRFRPHSSLLLSV